MIICPGFARIGAFLCIVLWYAGAILYKRLTSGLNDGIIMSDYGILCFIPPERLIWI